MITREEREAAKCVEYFLELDAVGREAYKEHSLPDLEEDVQLLVRQLIERIEREEKSDLLA